MAPKSGIKLKLKGKSKAVKATQDSDVSFTSFNEERPKYKELRLICESVDEKPGNSKVACEEVIKTKSGLTLEATVNAYRREQAAITADTGATEGSLPVTVDVDKGQRTPKPGKRQPNRASRTEDETSNTINDPDGVSAKQRHGEQTTSGGVTRAQLEDYNKVRMILSKRRREEQARLRLADEERRGRLAAGMTGFNDLAEIPEEYRTRISTLGGWEFASSRVEAVAHALFGGKDDYGFGDNLKPSVQDVLMLRMNFARYRPDLADPTGKIDIVWRQWDIDEARLKQGTFFTDPVIDPDFDFVPRGPGEWRFAEVYANKPNRSAAEVWRMRQEARAQMRSDGTQHLSIEWWPNVPGLYSPRSAVGFDDEQTYEDVESGNDGDDHDNGEGASKEIVEEVDAEGVIDDPSDAGRTVRGKRNVNGRPQEKDTEQFGGREVTNTKTRRGGKTAASNADESQ